MAIIAKDSTGVPHLLLTDTSGRILTVLTDGTTNVVVDAETGGLVVSRALHQRVVNSNLWITSYIKVELASDADFYLHLKVGAAKNAHLNFKVQTEGKVYYALCENPTTTNDGTALTEVCINRQSPGTATMAVLRDPTVGADGTELETSLLGTTGFFTAAGGIADGGGYWILKKGEQYLLKVTNKDDASKDVALAVVWHEME